MSGDWIKMRSDLFTHPKVVRISSALAADKLRTVGGLMSVWCLFDAHSVDGKLEGYTPKTLDDHLQWQGFAEAMASVGWLLIDKDSLILPEFETHNGASAKRRAQDADRKRADRKTSALEADEKRTREEKKRVKENKENFDASQIELPVVINKTSWLEWVEFRKAKKNAISERAAAKQIKMLSRFDQATQAQIIDKSIGSDYQGLFAPKGASPPVAIVNSNDGKRKPLIA